MDDERVSYDTRNGCMHCGSLTFSSEYYNAFKVLVCNSCKTQYDLISKGNAKSLYLLTDTDLKRLGSITKSNPQKKNWSPMRLYLLSQVEEAAHKKHGGPEGLEEQRRTQLSAKVEKRAAKRKEDSQKEEQAAERLKQIKERIEQESKRGKNLPTGEVYNDETGMHEKVFGDGPAVEVELI
ncbi:probable DNA repair protein rad14 [Coccomyxa sp. Obi]|nr:probable DNA repair protein rad14 [Coccomyxa sp. Obi]